MAAIRFGGPSGGGRASVGRTTRGSGIRWLLSTNASSRPASVAPGREDPRLPASPAPAAAVRRSRRVRRGSWPIGLTPRNEKRPPRERGERGGRGGTQLDDGRARG